jgi:hypothetical protein
MGLFSQIHQGGTVMYSRFLVMLLVSVVVLSGSAVLAQCGCAAPAPVYAPVAPVYTSYYAPAVTYYTPAVTAVPTVAYYTPYVSYYAPAAPTVSYYTPYAAYAPVVRPYAAYYYGVPGWSMYGTPKVYVPGEPLRNAIRATTP